MKTSFKNTVVFIIVSIVAIAFTTSCGTVHGFGDDVEKVGNKIEDSSR
jgi:predicted small secreted protein